jgi:hypothetical protein
LIQLGLDNRRNNAVTHNPLKALDNQATSPKMREWLGQANIATTRTYDPRNTRPEDSPKFKVNS